jgi:hypothetical protein
MDRSRPEFHSSRRQPYVNAFYLAEHGSAILPDAGSVDGIKGNNSALP